VRSEAFFAVGGFDERFHRPSVEDIDFGYRLKAAGHDIRLDAAIQGKHLKAWNVWSGLVADVRDRGVPWTRLIHRYGAMRNDLNLTMRGRLCVVLTFICLAGVAGVLVRPWLGMVALGSAAAVWWLERDQYAFLAAREGVGLAAAWFPLRLLHHLASGVSFVAGTVLHAVRPLPALRSRVTTGFEPAPARPPRGDREPRSGGARP
jgi:hypothetical protein